MVLNVHQASLQNASTGTLPIAQALNIRQSTAIPNIHVSTIGLMHLGRNNPVQSDFLERVANDPRASNFDSNYPAGSYVYAPQSTDISDAFAQVASAILHLAR